MIECYRCGAKVAPDRFDLEGWAALHVWEEDGAALFVCSRCQTDKERRLAQVANTAEGTAKLSAE